MFLSYIPTTKLASGPGEIAHGLAVFDYVPKENGKINKSLSGIEEAVFHSLEDIYLVKTQPIQSSEINKWREWFASTIAGETFTLDADDTATKLSPYDPFTMLRVAKSYKEKREGNLFVVSFSAKRVY